MNAYCPECETELDITTGICPACRWDPMAARPDTEVRPEPEHMDTTVSVKSAM